MRANGILMPISSLPSPYGIGAFDQEAYDFVDNLVESGQTYWQILPLGPTGYGDSPYQSFSTFAGNPYFISLTELVKEGLLTQEELQQADFGGHPNYVDYEKMYSVRLPLLRRAYSRMSILENEEFRAFVQRTDEWIWDYALFMAIKDSRQGESFLNWEEDIRDRRPEALRMYHEELREEVHYYQFLQFEFDRQWTKLKKYANERGIQIIGDIPFYVALDSADSWASADMFQFKEDKEPIAVAGCPPDGFSATGQLWGNPLYQWDYHKQTGFRWWIRRIRRATELYDFVRIDHFRGFDEYYSIPYGEETAVNGHWEKGPGMEFFEAIRRELGEVNIIAEDLGFLTDGVRRLLRDSGYPGMKVLQFAFDSREDSDYMPHHYDRNCIVYTGTHDNETTRGWFENLNENDRHVALKYMNLPDSQDWDSLTWHLICLAMRSVAKVCIIPMQDILCLGNEARMNHPSTLGDNWKWRMSKGAFDEAHKKKIFDFTKLYSRRTRY